MVWYTTQGHCMNGISHIFITAITIYAYTGKRERAECSKRYDKHFPSLLVKVECAG